MRSFIIQLICLVLLSGCDLDTENNGHIDNLIVNELMLGSSTEEVIKKFGDPNKREHKNSLTTFIYTTNGPGMKIQFKKDKLTRLEIYKEYLKEDWIKNVPLNEHDVLLLYGDAKEVTSDTCYHTAKCEKWIYKNSKEYLEILFYWDNESVDRIILGNK